MMGGGAQLARKTNGAPVKTLKIKPLRAKPKLPENFAEDTWARLQLAVAAVHGKRPVAASYEELYRAVEDLCLHSFAPTLYTRLGVAVDAHIGGVMAALEEASPDHSAFLRAMAAAWADHCEQMLTIRSIFLYLDRTYVIQSNGVKSLWEMGLSFFRQHLCGRPEVEQRAVAGALRVIEAERGGETVDRSLLKSLLGMFRELGTYPRAFERPFLAASEEFYAAESSRQLAAVDVPAYLLHCEGRLREEGERCAQYLDPATRKQLVPKVERQLLQVHVDAVLEKGFDQLGDDDRSEDLARLFTLMGRVEAHAQLRVCWSSYIKRRGQSIVMDDKVDATLVESLLALKAKLDAVLEQAFASAPAFANALKEAFEAFINMRGSRPAELVAKFVDQTLRSGNKGASDEELEAILERALTLFRYLQGKDVFEAFFKKDLAKRLLLGKSASIDAEKSMIAKLKAECGSMYTAKLEGMFKDIDISTDIMAAFRDSAHAKKMPKDAMTVHVLTMGFWPTYPVMEVSLPTQLTQYQDIFREFYLEKHSGRRLVWQNALGQCVLQAHFPKGSKKELQVSLFQAVVLMLFNDSDALSLEDIAAGTRLQDKELRRTLQSLACGKVRVLRKEPKGRDVEDGDMFHFNADFTSPQMRIKINAIQLKETVEENAATNERVFADRQYQVDAAIVRIMKTRKTLSHQLLISELMIQLKFPVKNSDCKKRIESLIDREYLERDRENSNIYNYLA